MVRKAGNASQKRPINQWSNANPLEALKDMASGIRSDFEDDFLKSTASDLLSEAGSLFGLKNNDSKISGDLSPDEVLDLTVLQTQKTESFSKNPKKQTEPAFRPLPENFIFHQKEQGIEQEIKMILSEIKAEISRLDEATKNMEKEATRVIIEQLPENPGVYHINFFTWLFKLIRDLRQKVEDTGAWLSMSYSRKAKKNYWTKFKKHGTSFGLSNERVVATQTG